MSTTAHESSSSGDDEVKEAGDQVSEELLAPTTPPKQRKPRKGGGVRFGSVRVRTHALTLGDNPGATTAAGPPLGLEWEPQNSTRFENINEFSLAEHGKRDSMVIHQKAKKFAPSERQQIAARTHRQASIKKIQMEVREIREEREKSKAEDIAEAEKKEVASHQHNKGGKKKGGGLFTRMFKK